jgi:hypothetical protein
MVVEFAVLCGWMIGSAGWICCHCALEDGKMDLSERAGATTMQDLGPGSPVHVKLSRLCYGSVAARRKRKKQHPIDAGIDV